MADFAPPDQGVLDKLKSIVGDRGWRDADDADRYCDDPRGRFKGQLRLVLLPKSTEEVAQIVRLCNQTRTGLIPYGGGTGVVAGQLSPDNENAVLVSLERMNRIREIHGDDFAMVVEAGCVLETIHSAAAEKGFLFPLSMASKGSCTIGGNLATNAGGIQVLRYGNARDLCLGIEAVLPTGEVLSELDPLRKNNTGYDLRHLIVGSEGTLGIITAATLELKPLEPHAVTAFCALASRGAALQVLHVLRQSLGDSLSALELVSDFGLQLVTSYFPELKNPLSDRKEWYLLAEFTGSEDLQSRVEAALADCLEQGMLGDVVIARSEAQRAKLWDLREYTPEANRLSGAICNSDTSVPISQLDRFLSETHDAVRSLHTGLRINSYGHIGDGNIHHNVFPPEGCGKAEFVDAHPGIIDDVRHAIDDVTVNCHGSISAEHGIGRLKTGDMESYSSEVKLRTLRQIKAAIDPNNIMNPGALFSTAHN